MGYFSKREYERVKDVLLQDKIATPVKLQEVVKSDVFEVLQNYIDLVPDSFQVELQVGESGYSLQIRGKGTRLKPIGAV